MNTPGPGPRGDHEDVDDLTIEEMEAREPFVDFEFVDGVLVEVPISPVDREAESAEQTEPPI